MRFGAHSQMFVHEINEGVDAVFETVYNYRLDAVEININDTSTFPVKEVSRAAERTGLSVVLGTALKPDQSTIHPDASVRKAGLRHLEECVRIAAELGAETVAGGLHSANGVFNEPSSAVDEWNRSVEALQAVGEVAERELVTLTVEPVSRYSGSFLNTAADGLRLVREVNSPRVALQLDTFHMNIEEHDSAEAIRMAGSALKHLHAVENNRGVPGTGQVPWKRIFEALKEINYEGLLVYEHFPRSLPVMARRTHTWRHVAGSNQVCVEGTENLRKFEAQADLSMKEASL